MNVLLILNDEFVALPTAQEKITQLKQQINSDSVDQFLLSNIVLNKVELGEDKYDQVYYLDASGESNTTIPNNANIKKALKSEVSLLRKDVNKAANGTKVGTKLSSLKFKRLNKSKELPELMKSIEINDEFDKTEKLKFLQAMSKRKGDGEGEADSQNDEEDDDEEINEDELLENIDLSSIICIKEPLNNGTKRRKACKDCTCGLAELEQEEIKKVETVKKKIQFSTNELNEVDFTIEGKTGGCGSCSLGDAFRCSGCPFLGLPAFKPGQVITLDSIADDL